MDRGWVAGRAIRVRKMPILDSYITIIARIAVDDTTNHTKVLGVLDLEATKLRTVLYESDLALKADTEVYQSLVIGLVTASVTIVSQMGVINTPVGK